MPETERYSRPALPVDGGDAPKPRMTTTEARDNLVAAADRYRAEGSEKAAWAMEAAAWKLIAATYEVEGL